MVYTLYMLYPLYTLGSVSTAVSNLPTGTLHTHTTGGEKAVYAGYAVYADYGVYAASVAGQPPTHRGGGEPLGVGSVGGLMSLGHI